MKDDSLQNISYKRIGKTTAKKLSSSFSSEQGQDILNQLKSGDNQYLKYERITNSSYDMKWIKEIEDCIIDLGSIIKHPLIVTKEDANVLPVELARKINGESVTHLATHSQYVKEQKDNGEVVPNKILNIGYDDFYQTYENRFIATLVRKLVLFIEKRYQFLMENLKIKRTNVMMVKNKSIIDGKEVEIETKIKVSSDEIVEEQLDVKKDYVKRVKELKRYILYYYNSEFMRKMKTERNVRNPILMTNIIRKNPLYNKCYRLYKFIEQYDLLGMNFKVKDQYTLFNNDELEDINNLMAASFLAINPSDTAKNYKNKIKKYKPRVITNTDDDKFVYGPYFKGPMEFVRADEQYLNYLDAIIKPTPLHPTKEERTYYGLEISFRQEIKDELREIELLLRRKRKDYAELMKEFERIVEQRQYEALQYEADRRKEEEDKLLAELQEARRKLMEDALGDKPPEVEAYDPFANLKKHEFIPFSDRLDNSEESLKDAYERIRHVALCYGLHSRVSQKADTMRLHNTTYLKMTIVGKTLKCHFALDPAEYADSSFPIRDDSGIKAYEDIPLLLKVRSELSVKRAIKLVEDLAAKFGLTYNEIISEDQIEIDNDIEETIEESEDIETSGEEISTPYNPFANLKRGEFVSFTGRIENSEASLKDAYEKIKHHALCYGLHSRVSNKADSFRLHNINYLRIAVVGKSLKLHYNLDPADYTDSSFPIRDDSDVKAYEDIPLMFKVRSDLSVKRAMKLIDDLATKFGLTYSEIISDDQIEFEDEEISEPIEQIEAPIINNPFANLKRGEFVSFSDRISSLDPTLQQAYNELRHLALSYGMHDRLSKKYESFRLHNVNYLRFAVVGKSLRLHFNLSPQDYIDTPYPIKDDSNLKTYEEIPLMFKVRSDLSIKRASKLIEDLASKYGFTYNDVIDESQIENEVEDDSIDNIDEDNDITNEVMPYNPFANLRRGIFISFEERLNRLDASLVEGYHNIRNAALSYGLHSRLSKKCETFRLHNITYLRISVVGKSLRLHFNLSPSDYLDSPIPVINCGHILKYESVPLGLKVRSQLSIKRAIQLIGDLAKKYEFIYNELENENIEEDLIENEEEEIFEEEEEATTEIVSKFSGLRDIKIPSFEERLKSADEVILDCYKQIKLLAQENGLRSRISHKFDTFKKNNIIYLKANIIGKSLKLHFRLNPKDYVDSALPYKDDSDKVTYSEVPFCFKVRSQLSVKRAIKLLLDTIEKNK